MRRAALVALAVVAAGCGGGGRHAQVTVLRNGPFPAQTVTMSAGTPALCRRDAAGSADYAAQFLAHSGQQAAYPADLYYVELREAVAAFRSHECDPAILGAALKRRLTAKQRADLVAGLPRTVAATLIRGLKAAR